MSFNISIVLVAYYPFTHLACVYFLISQFIILHLVCPVSSGSFLASLYAFFNVAMDMQWQWQYAGYLLLAPFHSYVCMSANDRTSFCYPSHCRSSVYASHLLLVILLQTALSPSLTVIPFLQLRHTLSLSLHLHLYLYLASLFSRVGSRQWPPKA